MLLTAGLQQGCSMYAVWASIWASSLTYLWRVCPRVCSVGMLFLPNDDALEAQAKSIIDEVVAAEGLKVLGYRQVPVDHAVVGRFAKATQPRIWQVRIRSQVCCGVLSMIEKQTVNGRGVCGPSRVLWGLWAVQAGLVSA